MLKNRQISASRVDCRFDASMTRAEMKMQHIKTSNTRESILLFRYNVYTYIFFGKAMSVCILNLPQVKKCCGRIVPCYPTALLVLQYWRSKMFLETEDCIQGDCLL